MAVYAVWFEMVASDARQRWPRGLFDDPRVQELWDEERVVGRWFASRPALGECRLGGGEVAWDAYYLFPPEARWQESPAPLLASACPIVEGREQLRARVEALSRRAKPRDR